MAKASDGVYCCSEEIKSQAQLQSRFGESALLIGTSAWQEVEVNQALQPNNGLFNPEPQPNAHLAVDTR